MNDLIVCKTGGSSLASIEDLTRVRQILEDNPKRRVLLPSAPGKSLADPTKATDYLIQLSHPDRNVKKLVDKVVQKYANIYPDCLDVMVEAIETVDTKLEEQWYAKEMESLGEHLQAKFLARELDWQYVDGADLFVLSDDPLNPKILPETYARIKERVTPNKCVISGHRGRTTAGRISTLTRGGTDTSAAYVAASLKAVLYENFTDQDGVFCADPRLIENPALIPEITFREMRDLSYSGFGIIHSEAMKPVARARVPVHIRNTFNYPNEGTYIVHERIHDKDKPFEGVAYKQGFCSFDIELFGLNDHVGIAADLLGVFKKHGISIEYLPTTIDDFSIVLSQDQLTQRNESNERQFIGQIFNELYDVLGEDAVSSSIDLQKHLGCLVVAGQGLEGRKGISADIQMTLARSKVNVKFISQGPRERCIVYGVDGEDGLKGLKAIYKKYLK